MLPGVAKRFLEPPSAYLALAKAPYDVWALGLPLGAWYGMMVLGADNGAHPPSTGERMPELVGPTPRGVRRCQYRYTYNICGERFAAGPSESVVALCDYHAEKIAPHGTYAEQVEQYEANVRTYGWKAS